ncbi:hypothetical protein P154DRAFT_534900 [Amniculicola lignicola CBS 123094]|uniref:Uncharacterized protein n=1 Tax=Amniculicola lignicola CBS 123094 TaxID=1392246 RepID=A0A6A5WFP3_9PLEO|nr:hypothetical protein P154DRAFT_534900 [Amniculicola lignicola CBS 123094]
MENLGLPQILAALTVLEERPRDLLANQTPMFSRPHANTSYSLGYCIVLEDTGGIPDSNFVGAAFDAPPSSNRQGTFGMFSEMFHNFRFDVDAIGALELAFAPDERMSIQSVLCNSVRTTPMLILAGPRKLVIVLRIPALIEDMRRMVWIMLDEATCLGADEW